VEGFGFNEKKPDNDKDESQAIPERKPGAIK
jgi:hypothetical protein